MGYFSPFKKWKQILMQSDHKYTSCWGKRGQECIIARQGLLGEQKICPIHAIYCSIIFGRTNLLCILLPSWEYESNADNHDIPSYPPRNTDSLWSKWSSSITSSQPWYTHYIPLFSLSSSSPFLLILACVDNGDGARGPRPPSSQIEK